MGPVITQGTVRQKAGRHCTPCRPPPSPPYRPQGTGCNGTMLGHKVWYGYGRAARRGVRRQQKSKTEDVRECHYILPTTQYYYVSEQAASFCSSTTEAAAIATARAAVSTANNGLTSYQQTIQAMSEENRRRRRQPQQPLKQPRPASNWFEAVLQTCMTHKGHHHGLFFSISQHSSHSSRSSLQQEVMLLQDYCTATQRRPAFLVAWNDANGIYLSQYWTGWQQQGHGQLIVALQSLEFWKQRQRGGCTEATRRTSLHNGHEFPNLCNDRKTIKNIHARSNRKIVANEK